MRRPALALALLLAGCPKEEPPVAAPAAPLPPPPLPAWRTEAPAPLAPRAFQLPALVEGKLSNGVPVVVVENHEVPLVYVRFVFEAGSADDPASLPGLASVTFDSMDQGADKLDAAGISKALKTLGSELGTGAGLDSGEISIQALRDRLLPTLDLAASIARSPTFPKDEWTILQKQRVQDLGAARNDPRSIADRVWRSRAYGDTYAGRLPQEAAYKKMKVSDAQAWYASHVRPENLTILVGGDITLAEIQPALEARFGTWKAKGKPAAKVPPQASARPAIEKTTIYLADKPGAAQSVISVGAPVPDRLAPDHTAFQLANRMVGGQFTARMNMNLREAKGWTYGTRSDLEFNRMGGMWSATGNFVTPHTAESLSELIREVAEAEGARPLTEAELEAARSGYLGAFPLGFENPGALLSQTQDMRRYSLPADWVSGFPDRIRKVTLAEAQASWSGRMDPSKLLVVIVGDAAVVQPSLEALGHPVVRVDADGKALPAKK